MPPVSHRAGSWWSPSPPRRCPGATIDTIAQTLVPDAPARTPDGAIPGATRAAQPFPGDRAAARRRAATPWAGRAAAAVVVVGAAVRIEQFGWRRSLWLDEALVTANIVGRDFRGLLHPLSGQQGAPVGWLWAERAAVLVLGNDEYALRLVPVVAGIAALVLVWSLARRLIGPWPAVLALAVLAASPDAVRYSVEVKQYSSDLAIALALTLLAVRAARPGHAMRAVWSWGAAGAVAVWCSHPAVLVLAGTAAALTVDAAAARDRRRVRRVLAASCPWLGSFAADWWVSLRPLGHNSSLHAYWAAGFAPTPLRARTLVVWLGRAPLRLVRDPGGLAAPALAAAVVAAGLVVVVRRRPSAGAALVLPLVAGLAAATVGAYPLIGRMALWTLPIGAVGLAAAVAALASVAATRLRPGRAWVGVAVAVAVPSALLAPSARQLGRVAHDPTTWNDIRPLLQAVHPYVEPGDLVWAHSLDAPSAGYYAVSTGTVLSGAVYDAPSGGACPDGAAPAVAARGRRVWFVYGYRASTAAAGEAAAIDASFASSAHLVSRVHRPQATASLWDFGAGPDSPGAPPTAPGLVCLALVPVAVHPTGLPSGPLGTGRPT